MTVKRNNERPEDSGNSSPESDGNERSRAGLKDPDLITAALCLISGSLCLAGSVRQWQVGEHVLGGVLAVAALVIGLVGMALAWRKMHS